MIREPSHEHADKFLERYVDYVIKQIINYAKRAQCYNEKPSPGGY